VVTADLVHPQGNRLVLVGVLALDHQHRDAVDEKDHILPRAVVAVVKGPLLGDFKDVARRIVVIDQDQVALALLLVVEELAPVAQMLDEFAVAVDVGVQMAELPEQGALGFGIARVEFPQLGVEQVVEEERAVFGAVGGRDFRIKAAPLLGFLAGHKGPADGLGIAEDAGLDGFVFAPLGPFGSHQFLGLDHRMFRKDRNVLQAVGCAILLLLSANDPLQCIEIGKRVCRGGVLIAIRKEGIPHVTFQ
jgi:hypothetical protein